MLVLPYLYPVGNSSPAMYAIQFSKPLITSNIYPFSDEFKTEENALIVESNNKEQLVKAINRVLEDKELKRMLQEGISKKKYKRDWGSIDEYILNKVYRHVNGT